MDKRRNPLPKDVARDQRKQFYEDVGAGKLSLQETAKKMRAISGLTQPEFAKHRGVNVKLIRALEAGTANPTIKSLNQIAEIFGLEVSLRAKSHSNSDML
jgi:DNA-binding XRE family transcriptional regulator